MKIAGAVAWVTGASSGIGQALVRELAYRGARVAATARRAEALHALAESTPGEVVEVPADVTDREAIAKAAVQVGEVLGPIDLAVLNAGVWQQVDVDVFDSEVFRRHMETNLMGMVHGIEAVLPGMRKRRSGTIAGIASVAGYRGFPHSEAYGATKAAQINLLEALRIDLQSLGINVVTVCPGFVRTEATAVNAFPMPFMIDAPTRPAASATAWPGTRPNRIPTGHDAVHEGAPTRPVRPYTWAFGRDEASTPRADRGWRYPRDRISDLGIGNPTAPQNVNPGDASSGARKRLANPRRATVISFAFVPSVAQVAAPDSTSTLSVTPLRFRHDSQSTGFGEIQVNQAVQTTMGAAGFEPATNGL